MLSEVAFYQNGQLIGAINLITVPQAPPPYTFTWKNVPAGNYTLTAVAYSQYNFSTTSTPVTITVAEASGNNAPPTIELTGPANNTVVNAPATFTLTATANDTDGAISKVEFYNGATLLGAATAAPYSFVWSDVAAGTYTVTAKAYDNLGAVTTGSAIMLVSNTLPTANITAPANNATYTAPANITLTASAADSDGSVSKVEFYNGPILIGTATAAPYTVAWNNVVVGIYSITAKTYDNRNAVVSSMPVSVIVNTNQAPIVSITMPVDNTVFTSPATFTLTATAADSDGSISKVEFYNGATLLGTATAAPYSFTWSNVVAGTYSVTAKAYDNLGAVTTSSAITLVSNILPTVSITAPANNATFTAPANITLTASAADNDGSVSKVEFYNGATLVGTATTAPYTVAWSNVVAGSYSLTARVYDNRGSITTSAVVTVVVSAQVPTDITTYFHNDISGTPLLATNATGQVVWKESYRPYGQKLTNPAAAAGNKVGYAGKPFDNNTGLSYMGARYYDPLLGRFTGVDPKEVDPNDLHSFNRYAYANNNPYKYVDPDGRNPVAAITTVAVWMVGGAVIGGGTNALAQWMMYGEVHWGGIGGVVDAAGDGVILGPVLAGAAARNPGRAVSEIGGVVEARAARDALAAELAPLKGKAPATVTGGYNIKTGEVAARACGGGKCAEDHVVDALGGVKGDVRFTEAVRPRTGTEVPVCSRCETNFGREAFPKSTRFKSDE
jgi:RHS repeat-associated protein